MDFKTEELFNDLIEVMGSNNIDEAKSIYIEFMGSLAKDMALLMENKKTEQFPRSPPIDIPKKSYQKTSPPHEQKIKKVKAVFQQSYPTAPDPKKLERYLDIQIEVCNISEINIGDRVLFIVMNMGNFEGKCLRKPILDEIKKKTHNVTILSLLADFPEYTKNGLIERLSSGEKVHHAYFDRGTWLHDYNTLFYQQFKNAI